jgi:hypothetical protein
MYIEEEQTTQWPKEKVQMTNNDLQKEIISDGVLSSFTTYYRVCN